MFDVIVIGARCAGAPTAMHLAKKGYKVLVVDRRSTSWGTSRSAEPTVCGAIIGNPAASEV